MRRLLIVVVFLAVVAWGLLAALSDAKASPDDPALGGCAVYNADWTCKLSLHPTALAPLTAINLKKGTITLGAQAIPLGLCYGVTWQPGKWYASGGSFCVNTIVGQSVPTQVFPSLVLQGFNWAAAGVGTLCTERTAESGMFCQVVLLFGVNVPIQ